MLISEFCAFNIHQSYETSGKNQEVGAALGFAQTSSTVPHFTGNSIHAFRAKPLFQ